MIVVRFYEAMQIINQAQPDGAGAGGRGVRARRGRL